MLFLLQQKTQRYIDTTSYPVLKYIALPFGLLADSPIRRTTECFQLGILTAPSFSIETFNSCSFFFYLRIAFSGEFRIAHMQAQWRRQYITS